MEIMFQKKALALAIGISCAVTGHTAFADGEHLDNVYNEEAIYRVLAERDPQVGYMTRLIMMKAHLKACLKMLADGDLKEAAEHVSHPRVEILGELEPELAKRNAGELVVRLAAAETELNKADASSAKNKVLDAMAYIDGLTKDVKSTGSYETVRVEVASILLRTAVVEYHEAFEYSKLSNMVEYHDGLFFVAEAKSLLQEIAPGLEQRDSAAHKKLFENLEKLSKAWPQDAPPRKAVLPATRMQAMVSIIDAQLGRLR
jgi:hypothetical protein